MPYLCGAIHPVPKISTHFFLKYVRHPVALLALAATEWIAFRAGVLLFFFVMLSNEIKQDFYVRFSDLTTTQKEAIAESAISLFNEIDRIELLEELVFYALQKAEKQKKAEPGILYTGITISNFCNNVQKIIAPLN